MAKGQLIYSCPLANTLLIKKMFSNKKKSDQTSLSEASRKPAISYGGSLNLSENSPTILAEILQTAATTEQGIIYIQPDQSEKNQSYHELFLEAQRILYGLRKLGLQPQDKVVFKLDR
ncbi:MAG: hypothetical protein F6K65_38600 [Moorea sp. SIO3C2]|nr:hypothetical protein [Moorena sp. SIO3C2]